MKKDPKIFISHILENIENIQKFIDGVLLREFLESAQKQYAVIRGLEIIGEATKNLPASFREKYPDVPWSEMARTRDKLIHGYFAVDLELAWKIVKEDIPELKKQILEILEDWEDSG